MVNLNPFFRVFEPVALEIEHIGRKFLTHLVLKRTHFEIVSKLVILHRKGLRFYIKIVALFG